MAGWGAADWRRFAIFASTQTGTPMAFFLDMPPGEFLAWLGTAADALKVRNGR